MKSSSKLIAAGAFVFILAMLAVGLFFFLGSKGDIQCLTANGKLNGTCGSNIDFLKDVPVPVPVLPVGQSAEIFVGDTWFDNSIKRVSSGDFFSVEEGRAIHSYSRRQVWNADETLMLIGVQFLDATTLSPVSKLTKLSTKSVWSNVEPELMFGIAYDPEPNVLSSFNVRTKAVNVIGRFPEYDACSIGRGEGNISNDDRYILLVCSEETGNASLVSYDLQTKKILGIMKAAENLNWGSFTQSGEYIVVENSSPESSDRELLAYSKTFDNERLLTTDVEHGDLGVDSFGSDAYVMIDKYNMSYIRISDGARVSLNVGDRKNSMGYGHVSCRNLHLPGWCFVSAQDYKLVAAVRVGFKDSYLNKFLLDKKMTIRGFSNIDVLGFHWSSESEYTSQAKATVNPSGTEVVVTSDWLGQAETSDYLISIRP